jgi:hypothetical protein
MQPEKAAMHTQWMKWRFAGCGRGNFFAHYFLEENQHECKRAAGRGRAENTSFGFSCRKGAILAWLVV